MATLPPEEQERILNGGVRGTQLETDAVMHGLIDPRNIREYRLACREFKTQDSETLKVKEKAMILSKREEPVLILGESGTGKELLARIIHGDRTGQFVAVNVCAVTDTLFESELFGHVKGAFTGADRDRIGLIKQAEGGTLFLDEIGDMPVVLQAKMLRVIQFRTYRRVGSPYDEKMNCRVIAATHRDLRKMIDEKTFRLDLYERLQVFRLSIKPLRDRLGDMELYVGKDFVEGSKFMDNHRDELQFSGNVRQLMNLKLKVDVFGEDGLTLEDVL